MVEISASEDGARRRSARAIALRYWPAFIGVAILVGLWSSPLVPLARRAFSAHMMLHLGIVTIASPLIVIGALRVPLVERVMRPSVATALAASLFDLVIVWGWHAPVLHEAAARHTGVFVFQQASFLAAGVLVWGLGLAGRSRRDAGLGAMSLAMTFMHMSMLGVLLSIAPRLIYAPDVCQGAFGFTRLSDQRLGGAMMAVWGGLPYLGGALLLVTRLLADDGPPRTTDATANRRRPEE
ncbi:cytochrome c oxidase assembly protein [Aurantimonas sp. VKM B-3413]|uniref:cytochrome c oxidase assembly protein n=1 Tax=Aurantimonas sp. VKM B-3413 TaxID=2779401 RepID=UPI001E4062C5|nr:cytochrome c oxidase assembly protein [Aurantimonas sp. VKM B-3413]MCB8837151.1 cytochrome c oxidase assembly protein [Aurantimonas sp. VKM B-3413]